VQQRTKMQKNENDLSHITRT